MFDAAWGARAGGRSHRSLRGFTLIEVLVVVAIIALLISILLPSLARARYQAKLVACRGRLHDLGTAFTVYTETYKGYYPITPDSGTDTYWSLYKARLLKNTDVLICPSTQNVIRPSSLSNPPKMVDSVEDNSLMIPVGTSDIDKVAAGGPKDSSGGHSYEYNGAYDTEKGKGVRNALAGRHKRTTFFRVAFHQLMLVHDADEKIFGARGCENSIFGNGNNCPQPPDAHGAEGMNVMFGDGHSDFVKKLRGKVTDFREDPPKELMSESAEIDKLWLLGQYPWMYRHTK